MAMLRNTNIAFSLIVMCLIVVSPIANAQLTGSDWAFCGGSELMINIQGRLGCSSDGRVSSTTNPTSINVPPFANARIVLRCDQKDVSSTITNAVGLFTFPPILEVPFPPSTLLSSRCRLIVTTPLNACNANLPASGSLVAPLSPLGTFCSGDLTIANLFPRTFNLATLSVN